MIRRWKSSEFFEMLTVLDDEADARYVFSGISHLTLPATTTGV